MLSKHNFHGLDNSTWLYNGAETPPLVGAVEAVNAYMRNREGGPKGREMNSEVEQSLRENAARLINGRAQDIALVSNASEAITLIVQALRLQAGDNVIINTLEFPSGVLPWLLLKEHGVEVRLVEHTDWQVTVDDMMAVVDERTKLVMASHVSFVSGARLDYQELYRRLLQTNALLLLDVTQSLGAVPVDLQAADIIVCSSYKWLMSIHGLGLLALNPARTEGLLPGSAGWRGVTDLFYPERFSTFEYYPDARRFELGYPNYAAIYTMEYSTGLLLKIGVEQIERHILQLGGYMIQRLQESGYTVMTPIEEGSRAGNISFVCENGEETANRLLQEHNVYLWGGDGRLRASVHLFNDSNDVDSLIKVLSRS
ncbi:aminotransferase class V-fold PLP-dependent enzyme [Paenibacillus mendelii]|uniref:Aminotransferase class V-fold PLP-dependent enzyme n=1 Tax=Paenibacillus mendelii TaxID=206163 RepID=A0ABV6JNA4_9BACL|nr:aminotransferase class V-fold PLP-dependent enzyme [Paenibacillus mendelii]MCQ6559227.1 aminotransferase class V-fold PLP-dependent enzyme [Paenibacillus mendelii]